jgi:hypothetical protein
MNTTDRDDLIKKLQTCIGCMDYAQLVKLNNEIYVDKIVIPDDQESQA